MRIFSATKDYCSVQSPCHNSFGAKAAFVCNTWLWWSWCWDTCLPAPLHPAKMGFVMEHGLCGGVWSDPVVTCLEKHGDASKVKHVCFASEVIYACYVSFNV